MQRILINTQSFLLGETIMCSLTANGDFSVTVVEKPREIVKKCAIFSPTVLLMEVTCNSLYNFSERIKIRDEVKRIDPNCKIVLLADETADTETAEKIVQAKKSGVIEQFVFNSVSITYLSALLDTL